ncbi:MAG TPA: alpha/beta hydrolase [Vicinamibacterales bacterium]|nr:alpha/beta hydrolase [Vicinamibacterales bacterium]
MSRSERRERVQYLAARALAHLPDALKIRLSGEPPVVVDGQPLDPQLQLIRSVTRGRPLPGLIEPTVAAGRDRYRRQTQVFRGPVTAVAAVRDLDVAGASGPLRARHFAPSSPRDAPLLVYFHGGGFVIGDLETHDEPCRILCRHAGLHVLSVAYRLAPEHPFPAAVDDARSAFAWARMHAASLGAREDRVAVGGDSAGGNLAAVVSEALSAAASRGEKPVAQLLIYPATDFSSRRRSQDLFASGFYITRRDIDGFRDHYVGASGVPLDDPRLSPLYGSRLADLPPTLIVIAGFDPLRDDGEAYAAAVQEAGAGIRVVRFPSLGHGFIHMTGVAPAAREAMIAVARDWRALVDSATSHQMS